METRFTNFITAFKAEQIKKRGTGFYWTSVIMGVISPILYFIVCLIRNSNEIKSGIPYNLYSKVIEDTAAPFANFFFPLFIIIMVSRITQIDHKNGGWQLMETQPAYKFSIYFSKFLTLLVANLLSIASFLVASLLCAWLLTYCITIPKNALLELPLYQILSLLIRFFLAALLVTSLQYVISVLMSSFIWSILIGFFGLLLTMFLSPFKLTPVWYPYEILAKVADTTNGSQVGHYLLFTEYIGIVMSLMFLYIGFGWYQHKRFKSAFWGNSTQLFSLLGVLLFGNVLLFWLLKPNEMANHTKTIICGTIHSSGTFQNIYIRDGIANDTIAVIPIKNNTFHYEITDKVIADYYECIIDGKIKSSLFFGTHDSIYLDGKVYGNDVKFDYRGTRLAENQMNEETEFNYSMAEYYLRDNIDLDKPKIIIKAIYNEWKDALMKPNSFRTIDNYVGKSDYTERSEKLVTTKYLNLWQDLVKKRLALYPNEPTKATSQIKEMQSKLSLTDESLLTNESYFNYIKSQLVLKNKQDIDENQKAVIEISKLKSSHFRDKLLFWQVRKSLADANSSEERRRLIATYQPQFTNVQYQTKIGVVYKEIESLGKGKVIPNFVAQTTDGTLINPATLKGKHVVVDVWATWCGPCKQQAPYFEKLALKYKNKKIQFVSLSIDEDVKKWYIEAKSKTKTIMHGHINDKDDFGKKYNVEGIPRFMLIDANGKFVNAKMPSPDDQAFEVIIRKALNLPDEE
ncbi:MAG: hypothetical protein CFE24_07160 [Flavobacterium sp. BFFFF2]|nr:MAG: hypothetical protein CFE24_07160 [Flavobacterium sp. BFFFF2]